MKIRLAGAQKGHSLLKKKSDALNMRFRGILKEIKDVKESLQDRFREANFALAEAKYNAGDISYAVVESVKNSGMRVRMKTDHVAGVTLPVFEESRDESTTTKFSFDNMINSPSVSMS